MRCLAILALTAAFVLTAQAQPSKVTFRDDQTILVDGRPFFPLGLYYCFEEFEDPTGKLLSELKNYGFNTLGFYRWGTPDWRAELERAHRIGFKVWVRGHEGFDLTSPAVERVAVEQVRDLRDHPALLFWEFQDEPLYNKVSIEGSRKGDRLVRREDPHHPLLTVEWPGAAERLHEWRGIGDVFAIDLYPIPRERAYGRLPNHDITQMRDYLQALRQAHGVRPFILVLQGWAWDPLKDGERGYPTPHESRFMAYQAVIHGAKGLHYYGQVHCTRPNPAASLAGKSNDPARAKTEFDEVRELNRRFWERHRPIIGELSQAARLFVLRDARPERRITVNAVAGQSEVIECRTKVKDDDTFVLAVNASSAERTATFRLPSANRAVQIDVLFERRKLPVKDGLFTDRFQPYDAHVYATTAALPE